MVNTIINRWNGSDEDKAVVFLYLSIVIGGFITLLFMVPTMLSAKSTVLVIFGAISPLLFVAAIWHLYRVFFTDYGKED